MPELPEVETVRRSLVPRLVGRRIERFDVYEHRLRYPVSSRTLKRWVEGREVETIKRRSKYLIVHLEGDGRLIFHLGMSGRISLCRADRSREDHVHVVFYLDDGQELRFRDPRRFGVVDAISSTQMGADRRFSTLGVEPG